MYYDDVQQMLINSDLDGISDVPGPVDYRSMHHVDNIFPENNTVLTPCEAFMNLQCRSCGQYLLHAPRKIISGKNDDDDDIGNRRSNGNDNDDTVMNTGDTPIVIRNVCHLPSGYWDEITDYLTCYDGVSTKHEHIIFVRRKHPLLVLFHYNCLNQS